MVIALSCGFYSCDKTPQTKKFAGEFISIFNL